MSFEFKPFSRKQLDVITNANSFINILEGAVRSGKTIAADVSWINFVIASPHKEFLMSGESTDSLYRNVIKDIVEILGRKNAQYKKSSEGGAKLVITADGKEKICYCRGAAKANDEGKIRGMTIAGWYADEITLHHGTFIKQAINRMSLDGAKALWTTNPDSPFHEIKKDYIDKAEENGYNHWKFNLDDNNAISEKYKENIKKSYSGIFYDRFIKGLWVLAEGVIYDMFSEKHHVVKNTKRPYNKRVVAVDYGTQNPTGFGMFERLTGTNTWYKTAEYHHSGRDSGQQKTDEQYADEMEKFLYEDLPERIKYTKKRLETYVKKMRKFPKVDIYKQTVIKYRKKLAELEFELEEKKDTEIIVDPSAASFILTLKRRGLTVKGANNDVLNGIRNVSTALKLRQLLICEECVNTREEFSVYIWDEKAQLRGEDKPLKENDHHMDLVRYFVNTVMFNGNNRENQSREGAR